MAKTERTNIWPHAIVVLFSLDSRILKHFIDFLESEIELLDDSDIDKYSDDLNDLQYLLEHLRSKKTVNSHYYYIMYGYFQSFVSNTLDDYFDLLEKGDS